MTAVAAGSDPSETSETTPKPAAAISTGTTTARTMPRATERRARSHRASRLRGLVLRQPSDASASLRVFDGRITAVRLGVVGAVVAADVGRRALDRDQLVDDLSPRSRRASRRAA